MSHKSVMATKPLIACTTFIQICHVRKINAKKNHSMETVADDRLC